MSNFKRKIGNIKLYEVYFNNEPEKQFDRISAYSAKEAKEKIQKIYPKDKITGIKCLS